MIKPLIFFLLLSTLTTVCVGQKPILDDLEYWRLSYRMVWSEMENEFEIGEKQLDSLLSFSNPMEDKILYVGIKLLYANKKYDKISSLITNRDSTTFAFLCSKSIFQNDLKDMIPCLNYFKKERVENIALQRQLVIMYIDDQNDRFNRMEELIKKYDVLDSELIALDNYTIHVDLQNQRLLKEIIDKYGFPTKRMVGSDGMDAVFYIIQHGTDDQEWQEAQLIKVKEAVKNGDMEASEYAYLYDRIQMLKGLPQRYGTQCSMVSKKENIVEIYTVEDPDTLDFRRKANGLFPIDFYKKLMLK